MSKLFAIALIFLGEAFAIGAEIVGAHWHTVGGQPFFSVFLRMLVPFIIGGALLIAGYIIGVRSFSNIWIVSALSITSIFIIEPVMGYVIFQQLPTKGSVIGLVLGLLGFAATILV